MSASESGGQSIVCSATAKPFYFQPDVYRGVEVPPVVLADTVAARPPVGLAWNCGGTLTGCSTGAYCCGSTGAMMPLRPALSAVTNAVGATPLPYIHHIL